MAGYSYLPVGLAKLAVIGRQIHKLANATDISRRVLCLPLYPDLGKGAVDRIAKIVEISGND